MTPSKDQTNATDRKKEIETQIDFLQDELNCLENDVKMETMEKGLKASGLAHAKFEVDDFNDHHIGGELTAKPRDGYDIQKLFGMHDYHERLDVIYKGVGEVSIAANDGVLSIDMRPEDNPPAYDSVLNIPKVKEFLSSYGIELTVFRLENQRDGYLTKANNIANDILTIQS